MTFAFQTERKSERDENEGGIFDVCRKNRGSYLKRKKGKKKEGLSLSSLKKFYQRWERSDLGSMNKIELLSNQGNTNDQISVYNIDQKSTF